MLTCGLCKKLIRGDEHYVTDHYKCSADLAQSFHSDIATLEAQRDKLLVALRCVLDSASPSDEHQAMSKAWKLSEEIIASVERESESC